MKLKLKSSFVRNMLILISSMIIGAVFNIPFGFGAVLDFVTAMIIYIVITLALGDVWYKVCMEKWKLCWQYWVGVVLILLADWAFLSASKTTTFTMMFIMLAITAVIGLGAGSWFFFRYKPLIEAKKKEALTAYRNSLVEKGLAEATADSIIAEAKEE